MHHKHFQQMSLLLLFLAAVVFTAAAQSNGGKLQIFSRTPQKLQATYHTGPEEGIQVVSEVNQQNNYVSVSTLGGVHLVYAWFSPSGAGVLWKILGHSFFLYSNTTNQDQPKVEPYLVPPASTGRVKREIQNDIFTVKLFRTLEMENFEKSKEAALSELFALPELNVIFEMSKSLGKAGIYGHNNPAALNFHGLALHFAKLRQRLQQPNGASGEEKEEEEEESMDEPVFAPRRIVKRATCTRKGFWGRKKKYKCNRCPRGSKCSGMCGPGCKCWKWVCGHCCYNQGCYEHDRCCGKKGNAHHKCVLPFGFNCKRFKC